MFENMLFLCSQDYIFVRREMSITGWNSIAAGCRQHMAHVYKTSDNVMDLKLDTRLDPLMH